MAQICDGTAGSQDILADGLCLEAHKIFVVELIT